MKKQVSLPVVLPPSKPDLDGAKDINPLIKNCQRTGIVEEKKKVFSTTTKSIDYKQPIHPIPSSQIVLNEEEKQELETVLLYEKLRYLGLR